MPEHVPLTEINIQKIFGHEAAEDEDPQRLREYYFKSNVFNQMVAELPLRILVGHKGIGKSALFNVALSEDKEAGRLAILIQPNDITHLGTDTNDFLQTIRSWTDGLTTIVIQKALNALGVYSNSISAESGSYFNRAGGIVLLLQHMLSSESNSEAVSKFLANPRITVYIDDLDRGWQGRAIDVSRISALLNAVRDISNDNREINFKIALRSDVYYLVRTSDESTDKIEGSVVWHTWTNHGIFILLIKRIETFFGRSIDERELASETPRSLSRFLKPIMESQFRGYGHWANAPMYRVMMSLIRKRPRDLIKLCTLGARHTYAQGGNTIKTEDFNAVFEEYSQGRLQDTMNEFRSELPQIESLLMNMKPSKKERVAKLGYVYTTADLLEKLRNISQLCSFRFTNGKIATPKELAAFLYKINFLTARKETSDGIVRKYFEENRYLSSSFADFGFDWEVHPAYRWALQPDSINSILQDLRLSSDDS